MTSLRMLMNLVAGFESATKLYESDPANDNYKNPRRVYQRAQDLARLTLQARDEGAATWLDCWLYVQEKDPSITVDEFNTLQKRVQERVVELAKTKKTPPPELDEDGRPE